MLNKMADTTEVHLGRTDRFFIGGHWIPPSSEASIDVIVLAPEEI